MTNRPECFSYEDNDCTVKSLAATTNGDYADAHKVLKDLGRKDKKGIPFRIIADLAVRNMGYDLMEIKGFRGTVQKVLNLYQHGNFIVLVRGHAIPIVSGKLAIKSDIRYTTSHVKKVWEIFKSED